MKGAFVRRMLAGLSVVALAVLGLSPDAEAKELPLLTPGCGTIVSQSFRLGADKACTGHGFVVGADSMTIDLNGHTIAGDGDVGDDGIHSEHKGVKILNGVVRHFGDGLELNGDKHSVTGVVSADNSGDGFSVSGDGTKLTDATAVANGTGLFLASSGTKLDASRVASNSIGALVNGPKTSIKNSYFSGNLGQGMVVNGSGAKVSGNTFAGNGNAAGGAPGLELSASTSKASVSKNRFFGNGDDGYRDSGTGNKASSNFAYGNGFVAGAANGVGTGIDATSAVDPKVKGNLSNGNDAATPCVPPDGCTAPKAEKLPIVTPNCGVTITQSFRLGADRVCTGNGFVIGVDNITIDLNDHTISGDRGPGDIGISTPSHNFSTIRNGVVRGFGIGVDLTAAGQAVVENVVSIRNLLFGFRLDGSTNTLRSSYAVANDANGISITSTSMTVDANYVSNNLTGVNISSLAGAVLTANDVSGNRNAGLVSDANGIQFLENTFGGNGIFAESHGMDLTSGLGSKATSNVFFGNSGDGYHDEGSGDQATNNIALANGFLALASDGMRTGIDASGGTFPDGFENFSLGNDATDQCEPDYLCEPAPP